MEGVWNSSDYSAEAPVVEDRKTVAELVEAKEAASTVKIEALIVPYKREQLRMAAA